MLKQEDIEKYLTEEQKEQLNEMALAIVNGRARDGKCPINSYYVCNKDEPYAEKVRTAIMRGEKKKNECCL